MDLTLSDYGWYLTVQKMDGNKMGPLNLLRQGFTKFFTFTKKDFTK